MSLQLILPIVTYEKSLDHVLNFGYYVGTGVASICLMVMIYSHGFGAQFS
jgi:hypothetical protein